MIQTVDGKYPSIPRSAYVHPSAVVIGDVHLGEQVSVWPCAVIRGDIVRITIGNRSNVQDGCTLHTSHLLLTIGQDVTIGHNAVLHSCDIGDNTLVGMGAIILDAAKVGKNCIVGAGTVIPGGKVIPDNSLVVGNPYRIVRQTTAQDLEHTKKNGQDYLAQAKSYVRTGNIL